MEEIRPKKKKVKIAVMYVLLAISIILFVWTTWTGMKSVNAFASETELETNEEFINSLVEYSETQGVTTDDYPYYLIVKNTQYYLCMFPASSQGQIKAEYYHTSESDSVILKINNALNTDYKVVNFNVHQQTKSISNTKCTVWQKWNNAMLNGSVLYGNCEIINSNSEALTWVNSNANNRYPSLEVQYWQYTPEMVINYNANVPYPLITTYRTDARQEYDTRGNVSQMNSSEDFKTYLRVNLSDLLPEYTVENQIQAKGKLKLNVLLPSLATVQAWNAQGLSSYQAGAPKKVNEWKKNIFTTSGVVEFEVEIDNVDLSSERLIGANVQESGIAFNDGEAAADIQAIYDVVGITDIYVGERYRYLSFENFELLEAIEEQCGSLTEYYGRDLYHTYYNQICNYIAYQQVEACIIAQVGENEYGYSEHTKSTFVYDENGEPVLNMYWKISGDITEYNDEQISTIDANAKKETISKQYEKIADLKREVDQAETFLEENDNAGLFNNFNSITGGVRNLTKGFKNLSLAIGNVFAFLPFEIITMISFAFVSVLVIIVVKAIRG